MKGMKKVKIQKLLFKLGIFPNSAGYEYISYILLIYENSNIRKNLCGIIYKDVAKKFKTSYSRVERDIRYIAKDKKVIERLNKILELEEDYKIIETTNSEFICILNTLI